MSRSLMLSLMNRATNGNELLAVADVIADEIAEANINDCAEYFASISAQQVLISGAAVVDTLPHIC